MASSSVPDESLSAAKPRRGSTTSSESEDVVLVRLENKILMDPASPSAELAGSMDQSSLDACPEEPDQSSPDRSSSPRTEGESTAAEATMPDNEDDDVMGRMTDELEAEFEAFLKSQTDAGAAPTDMEVGKEAEMLYEMEISVTEPIKQGEGMSSHLAYLITTKTNMPQFGSPEVAVRRKFAEFQVLQQQLVATHLKKGCVLPRLPESMSLASAVGSAVGMTRIRALQPQAQSSTTCAALDVVERRRAALQRYLNRVASHPALRTDPDFHDFLQAEETISKPIAASVMSGEGVAKLVRGVGNAIAKMTAKMSEADDWFDEKQKQYDCLGRNLKALHTTLEALVADRKDLANTSTALCRGLENLSHCEKDPLLSRTLAQFATVQENVQQIRLKQVDSDFFVLNEMVKDHLAMLTSIRACFQQRILTFQSWQSSQSSLQKKRDEEVRLLTVKTIRMDKVNYCREEIGRWEKRVEDGQKDFESMSKRIQEEVTQYEIERLKEFRSALILYMEKLMRHQQQMNRHWEELLAVAKSPAASPLPAT